MNLPKAQLAFFQAEETAAVMNLASCSAGGATKRKRRPRLLLLRPSGEKLTSANIRRCSIRLVRNQACQNPATLAAGGTAGASSAEASLALGRLRLQL
jgi:hypothetical protein